MTPFWLGSLNVAGPYFEARGEGLTECRLDESSGIITRQQVYREVKNAIWLARAGSAWLVASEHYYQPGEILAWGAVQGHFGETSRVQASPGGGLCHVAGTSDGTVFSSSYFGGLSVHEVTDDGKIAPSHQVFHYAGRGPHPERQQNSHPHQALVSPTGESVIVTDLGSDRLWRHELADGRLGPPHGVVLPAGSGPRHLAFHPQLPLVYVLFELDGRLRVLDAFGTMHERFAVATLPADSTPPSAPAGIVFHPTGRFLYTSSRGSDTISVFEVAPDGEPRLSTVFASGGRTPRAIALSPSGRWLVATNQDSDSVVAFELDPEGCPSGRSGPPLACGSPCCLLF